MARFPGTHGSEQGFGIMSVLVALVMLSVLVVAVGASTITSVSMKTEAQTRATAGSIAATYLEELKTRDPLTLVSEDPVQVDEAGEPDPAGSFERSVNISTGPSPNTRLVEVVILYPRGGVSHGTLKLVTIVYEAFGG
ncbi:MAG: hypothetical protein GWN99_00985 [Gemmatimonadetes bacterium]|uniref:Uncharacterized protein n=1 Tax=Candidatus Kutchimonas denitrificans TaxID=3056748 RepID=A0AAE5CCB7_9BACT|nr:hypothetical protein [Gemmatimonadota bacterium]NIR75663.1 hypothetical protein [Candidatus Kutchimonas denitrificans]NIR99642.1 hypothetical protein [Gemmatimonadota bacterium]NIT65917.1 hypothetical protein [Gemmatimonadota bacterium]NIV22086.1 hypothetical protein [Gemmatimonadota bacterium]